uniref:CSON012863 protein n=1 Tax=Culicoides sonorensis TaxID=179676 RepID=A0A336LMQ4_CULSO
MQVKKYDEHERPYLEICEGYKIRIEYEEVTAEYKEKAEIELRETPENVSKGLEELRELLMVDENKSFIHKFLEYFYIAADEHLFVPYERDDFLLKYLRPTKFYAKSAYDLMNRYYKFKIKYPKYCDNVMPNTVKRPFEHNTVNFQPKRDQHGRRILILSGAKDWTPEKFSLNELFRAIQVALELAMLEPMTQINGCIVIFDMTGITFSQLQYCSIPFALMLLEWIQHCAPLRLKAFHVVHNPSFFNMIFKFLKPFLGHKMKNRIFFHRNNMKRLLKHVSPDCLRPNFGGHMPCEEVDGKLLSDLFDECVEEFEVLNCYGYKEDKKSMKIPNIVQVTKGSTAKYVLVKDVIDGAENKTPEIPLNL